MARIQRPQHGNSIDRQCAWHRALGSFSQGFPCWPMRGGNDPGISFIVSHIQEIVSATADPQPLAPGGDLDGDPQGRGPVLSQPHIGGSQPQDDGKQTSLLTLGPSTFLVFPKSHLLTEGQGRSQRATSGTSLRLFPCTTLRRRGTIETSKAGSHVHGPLSQSVPFLISLPSHYIPYLFLRKSTLPVLPYLCLQTHPSTGC